MKHEQNYFYIEEKERNELLGINNRIFSGDLLKRIWMLDLTAEEDFKLHELIQYRNTLEEDLFMPEVDDKGHIVSYKTPCLAINVLRELGELVEKIMRKYKIKL